MATIYNVEVTSHWLSYSKEELEKIISEALKKSEKKKGNTIQVKVLDKNFVINIFNSYFFNNYWVMG